MKGEKPKYSETNLSYCHFVHHRWRTEEGGVNPPPPKFRSFDKVEPDCKLSGKCLVFLFQHPN